VSAVAGGRPQGAEAALEARPEVADRTADLSNDAGAPVGLGPAPDVCAWRLIDERRYLVIGEHARGGLGRILKARDCDLDRPVALKELLRESKDAESRFAREAEITARLQHPSIVPVYEAGRWSNGKPFYAMKLISGQSLATAIHQRSALRDRLALLPTLIAVADAIAYAHEQGVVHRDLKPSNVLIGRFGETVVIDWGLAVDTRGPQRAASRQHPVNAAKLAVVGAVMGTPEYMAPEQARGQAVDSRADVYALGAMLYHLVAGAPPYEGSSSAEVLSKLTAGPPVPLEKRQPGISEELAAIANKAMAREQDERYPSAQELAADLRRFQTGQLVGAHQYSLYRLIRRWLRRHRPLIAMAALCIALLISGSVIALRRILDERDVAQARRNEMILLQVRSALDRDPTAALAWLKTYPVAGKDWAAVRNLAAEIQSRGVARHVFHHDFLRVSYAGLSPDGALMGGAGEDATVRIWDLATGKTVRSIPNPGELLAFDFSPDGKTFMFNNWQGTTMTVGRLDIPALRVFQAPDFIIYRQFSPDGKLIATTHSNGEIRLWNLSTGDAQVLKGHQGPAQWADFSPDGSQLASCGADHSVRLWDTRTRATRILGRHESEVRLVRFSPDGKTVVSSGFDGSIRLWDPAAERPVRNFKFDATNWNLTFSPDGRSLVCTGGSVIRILDLQTSGVRNLSGHEGSVYTAVFSPDGRQLASGARDGTVRLWDLTTGQHKTLRGHAAAVYEVLFSKDGRYLASTSADRDKRVWSVQDIQSGTVSTLVGHDDQVQQVAFSPDGKRLASASRDNTVRLWSLAGGDSRVLKGHQALVFHVLFSPDGNSIASAGFDGTVRVWNVRTGEQRIFTGHPNLVRDIAFSHSGRHLVSAGADGTVRVWDVTNGRHRIFAGHQGEVRAAAFSPDDQLVATASADKTARVWNVDTGEGRIVARHDDTVFAIAFSPDGRRIASGGFDKMVQIVELSTGATRVLHGHRGRVRVVSFSPDGAALASASEDATARIWDLASGSGRVLSGHIDALRQMTFSLDGKRLATASWDNTTRLWNVSDGRLLGVDLHTDHVLSVAFSPDGRTLASAGTGKAIHLWKLDTSANVPDDPPQFASWAAAFTTAIVSSTRAVTP